MRKRRAFISFPLQHGSDSNLLTSQKVIDGLNIGFTVKIYSQVGVPSEAYITIYNLNREDMQFLTTSAATWIQQQTLIQLYAGYDDDVKLIFGGMINEAPPSGYPDVALSVKCLNGIQWMTKNIDVKKSNLKMVDLIDYVSSVTEWPVNIPDSLRSTNEVLNRRIEEFNYTGTVYNLLDKIQSMMGGFSVDKDSVFLSAYNDNIFIWSPTQKAEGHTLLVNKESGMIGLPELTKLGVTVKMLLNTGINTGDVIKVESDRVPLATGFYRVTMITHEGELRSNRWFTTLETVRLDGYDLEGLNRQ